MTTDLTVFGTAKVRDSLGATTREYPLGDFITTAEILQVLGASKFTRLVWRKKDGSVAVRDVKNYVKDALKNPGEYEGGALVPTDKGYVALVDMVKFQNGEKPWINVNVKNLIGVVTKGVLRLVKDTRV